jgi:SAM-dependent methyltransferase
VLGQVFTPAAVADLTLTLALEGGRGRVLDPACGDGVFLARGRARGVAIDGIEIDPKVAPPGVEIADFLATEPGAAERRYDAIVGNPPYVRQELLPPETKRRIAALVSGRADLALAFVVHALRFLRPGGRLAFVLSQAALDADYAEGLRALLDDRARLLAVVASPAERWFGDAALHGAIVVLEAGAGPAPDVRFARLAMSVARAAARVRGLDDLDGVARVRRVPAAEARRSSWGPYLRASDAWWSVAGAAAGALVPLGEVADLWRGATSGANEFFYPPAGSGIEARFLLPLLRTPRGSARISVAPESLPTRAFACDLAEDELPPGASAWVRAHAHLAERPTLRTKPRWWSLGSRPARAFLVKAYDARFLQPLAPRPLLCDQRLYALEPRDPIDPELLAAVLNGSLTAFALESLGRASMGEGALEWSVADARRLPIVDPRRLVGRDAEVRAAFRRLALRPVGTAAEEAARPDRRALDAALLAAVPGLGSLAPRIGAWHAEAVAERLARARGPICG